MRKKKKDLKEKPKTQSAVILIPVEQIIPNPNQPRKTFKDESLTELAESIRTFGVIQPIQVRKVDNELYELVSGERRLRASKLAGIQEIPAMEVTISDKDSAVIAIIENVQREDLSFFEEAESYRQLIKYYDMTQEQVAALIGKSQSFVANKIRLLKLDDRVIQAVKTNQLSERHARALLKIPDEAIQREVIEQIHKQDLNVKKTEALVEKVREEVMTNNYDEKITPGKKARVKSFINAQIYINTIKSAFKVVKENKRSAKYKETEKDDRIVITITIPK
ncbi:ParB/RepB/Spo0J family partition protein [Pseudoramibacter alactolyticus]|jgi:ParB family chromosome partitioning protein|uniref:ParB/RepB/Spo0J family partition protein n=1 Tax=Pseudoramibacter alactolyticus TaxID=113287 RepID=UPI0023561E4C|nr:ParB/RepB/Spo0J family partition protein [Pseudoramibacter alactolyticus]MBM6967729.1 ParB/RepB/Spo0J family partition protein [Pseudoramibacter alactolyticus]